MNSNLAQAVKKSFLGILTIYTLMVQTKGVAMASSKKDSRPYKIRPATTKILNRAKGPLCSDIAVQTIVQDPFPDSLLGTYTSEIAPHDVPLDLLKIGVKISPELIDHSKIKAGQFPRLSSRLGFLSQTNSLSTKEKEESSTSFRRLNPQFSYFALKVPYVTYLKFLSHRVLFPSDLESSLVEDGEIGYKVLSTAQVGSSPDISAQEVLLLLHPHAITGRIHVFTESVS